MSCRRTSTSRRHSLSLQRLSWTRAMCRRQNQCRSLWTSLPNGVDVLGALSSLLMKVVFIASTRQPHPLKRPRLNYVLIIYADFNRSPFPAALVWKLPLLVLCSPEVYICSWCLVHHGCVFDRWIYTPANHHVLLPLQALFERFKHKANSTHDTLHGVLYWVH